MSIWNLDKDIHIVAAQGHNETKTMTSGKIVLGGEVVVGSELVTSPDGSVTYVRDTDYTIDYPSGTITSITMADGDYNVKWLSVEDKLVLSRNAISYGFTDAISFERVSYEAHRRKDGEIAEQYEGLVLKYQLEYVEIGQDITSWFQRNYTFRNVLSDRFIVLFPDGAINYGGFFVYNPDVTFEPQGAIDKVNVDVWRGVVRLTGTRLWSSIPATGQGDDLTNW